MWMLEVWISDLFVKIWAGNYICSAKFQLSSLDIKDAVSNSNSIHFFVKFRGPLVCSSVCGQKTTTLFVHSATVVQPISSSGRVHRTGERPCRGQDSTSGGVGICSGVLFRIADST